MRAKEKSWLYENRYNIVFLVTLTIGLVIWLAVVVRSYMGYKRASVERKIVFDNFCEYVTDKDIEYIVPIDKSYSFSVSDEGVIVKLYNEEPRTFEPLRHCIRVSSDDSKYHVYLRDDNIVVIYVPFDGSMKLISN